MPDDKHNGTTDQTKIEVQSHGTGEQGVPGNLHDARLAGITADIRRLEDAAAEAKRPWYQRALVLTSLAAVLVSGTLSVLTIWMEQSLGTERDHARKVERLQQTVLELQTLAKSWTLEWSKIQDPQAQYAAGTFLGAQRQLLSEEAFELVQYLDADTVSSSQLSQIGYQLAQDMEVAKAEQLYKAVIDRKKSKNTTARRVSLSGLAELYMAPSSKSLDLFDPDKGRAKWKSLLDDIGSGDDNISLYLRADTLLRWAGAELNAGLAEDPSEPSEAAKGEGRRLLAQAEDVANKLMSNDPSRGNLLMRIVGLEAKLVGTTSVDTFAYDTVLPGVCEHRLLDNPGLLMDCALTTGANSLNFQIHVTEYDSNSRVSANLTGMLNLLDPTTAQIQWQRATRTANPMQPLLMTQGQTILHRVGTEARYRGQRPDLMTGGTEKVEYYFPAHAKMMGSKVAISSRGIADEGSP